MREYMGLYRGKRIDNGKWTAGSLMCSASFLQSKIYIARTAYCASVCDSKNKELMIGGFAEVDPDTVGECTGLRDKNGKLIFEGDIAKESFEGVSSDCDGEHSFLVDFEGYKIGRVSFGGHGAFITSTYGELWKDGEQVDYTPTRRKRLVGYRSEVIGNIHDNPELLKGGEGDG